ncbi:MAG TPA: serine/threonine-protein kinase [Vicinamibacterales bacterium]|nr:serine/threonine-protein kinase [Vicinamibacterales bacterium]
MVFRGQALGKYRILEPLGSGGFGTVYLAEDTWIDKRVAIKIPHRQNLDFGELLREPRLLASLNHPNIVNVITAEKQDNTFFIVMEYVPGETLEHLIANQGALDVGLALDYTCQVANAVEHAHKQGVIHRDLRPANVFVSDKGMVKVGDFGTSRFLELAAHGTTVIGSPPYMAPEQFEGRAVFASDLYSLGVSMYQMLTGDLPYDTPAPADLDRLRRGEFVRSARLKNPQVPVAVDEIMMKALSGEVSGRYQRAEDFLGDLLGVRRTVLRRPAAPPVAAAAAASPGPPAPEIPGAGQSQAQPAVISPSVPRRVLQRQTPTRIRTRDVSAGHFCWHCRKPLPARATRCPFCDETQ